MFFETSAKNGENIDKLFEIIAISIFEKNENDEKNLENAMNNDNRSLKLTKKNHKRKMKKNGFVKGKILIDYFCHYSLIICLII